MRMVDTVRQAGQGAPRTAKATSRPAKPSSRTAKAAPLVGDHRSVTADKTTDLESRADDSHHDSLRLWLRLLTCAQLIEGEVRARLRRDFAITLPRFDLLAQLERSPQGLRMGELSKRMMVTSGNVTGITDQLVAEGLVRRVETPEDRRAYLVRLTPSGKRAFDKMAAAHEDWVIELLGGLKHSERERLSRLLSKVKQHVNARGGERK